MGGVGCPGQSRFHVSITAYFWQSAGTTMHPQAVGVACVESTSPAPYLFTNEESGILMEDGQFELSVDLQSPGDFTSIVNLLEIPHFE